MSLFNILVDLPHERLRRLANEFGISSASPSKRTILNDLSARYRDESFISILVDDLSEKTQGLLRGLVFYTPETETISIPKGLQDSWCGSKTLEERLTPLLDLGLIFSPSSKEFEQVMFPEEIRRTLKAIFLKPCGQLQPQGGIDLDGMAVRHPGLEAIFHLLCVILHHRSIQTQKGMIHRKSAERWANRLGTVEAREDFFQFAFDYCNHKELFTLHRSRYRPAVRVGEWFGRDERILRNELLAYYLDTRLFPDRDMQILPVILRTSEQWINENQKAPVFSIADVVALMEPVEGGKILDTLEWFAFLGLIHLNDLHMPTSFSLTRDGIEIFCRCELPEAEEMPGDLCVLQPNFDLLVPPTFGYPVLWNLEHLAGYKRRDVFTEYHLSQHSILFGMRRGWTHDGVVSFFRELTGGKLSGNVQYSIDEWCRKYGQITLRRTVLVECATPELAEELAHVPEINGYLEQKVSDCCYAVAENKAKTVLRILRERGYEPSAAKRLTDEE